MKKSLILTTIMASAILISGCQTSPSKLAGEGDAGALLNLAKKKGSDFNVHDGQSGRDALLEAAVHDDPDVLRAVLSKDKEPKLDIGSVATAASNDTALTYATWNKKSENVKQLIEAARRVDAGQGGMLYNSIGNTVEYINHPNKFSITPLCYAAWKGDDASIRYLLEAGADIHKRCNGQEANYQPIHYAVKTAGLTTVELLISYGADLEAGNAKGSNPLLMAADYNNVEMVKALVNAYVAKRSGSNSSDSMKKIITTHYINSKNDYDVTPLAVAAWDGNAELAEYLLLNGAETEVFAATAKLKWMGNKESRWTPYMFARINGHDEVARMLRLKGANTEAVDPYGYNAEQLRNGWLAYNEEQKRIAERQKAEAEAKKQAKKDTVFKAMLIGAMGAEVNRHDIDDSKKSEIIGAFAADVWNDTSGTNMQALQAKNLQAKQNATLQKTEKKTPPPQKETTHTYTCPTPGSQQKSITVPYRSNACLEVKKEFAEVMACNLVNDFERVKRNCQSICGHPQCLE